MSLGAPWSRERGVGCRAASSRGPMAVVGGNPTLSPLLPEGLMSLVVQQSVTSTGLPSLVSRDTEAGRNEISCVRPLSGKEQSRAQPRGALLTPAPGPVTSCHLRVQSHVHVTCWGWSTC